MSDDTEKEALLAEAKDLGIDIDGRSSVSRIREKIEEYKAGADGPGDPPPLPPLPDDPPASDEHVPEGDIKPSEGEDLSTRDAMINRLIAFGLEEDDIKHHSEAELGKMFKQVKKARDRKQASEREAREKKKQGEDYGRVMNVSVLPLGEGKISTGQHLRGVGDLTYEVDEVIEAMPAHAAKQLIGKGWVREVEPKE